MLGHQHPDTLASMNNLASLYKARDQHHDMDDAERLLLEGVGTARRVLGEAHPYTRTFAVGLSSVRGINRDRRELNR